MNPHGIQESQSPSELIEQQASEWIERRDFGIWSEANAQALEVWLDQSIAYRVAFLRLDMEWKRTERLAALRPLRPHPPGGTSVGGRKTLRIAAVIGVLTLLGSMVAGSLFGPKGDFYSTPVGGHKLLTLADGSQIELNTNSALRIVMNSDHRAAVLLHGEAYFQIAHDAARPFVVTAGDHKVVDLGTKFLLRSSGSKLEVALVEGAARIESAENGATGSVVLKPGDVAFVLPKSVSVIRKPISDLQADLGWRRGVVIFRRATLLEATDEFNRYNTQKIIIADPETAHLTFSATLPTHDMQTFVRILGKLFNTHHQATADGIVISR